MTQRGCNISIGPKHWSAGITCVIVSVSNAADCCHNHFPPIRLMVIRSNTLSSCCLHSTFSAHLPVFYPSGRWSEEFMYAEMRVGRIFIHCSLDFIACECGEVN